MHLCGHEADVLLQLVRQKELFLASTSSFASNAVNPLVVWTSWACCRASWLSMRGSTFNIIAWAPSWFCNCVTMAISIIRMSSEFDGWSPGAAWEVVVVGFRPGPAMCMVSAFLGPGCCCCG